MLAIFFYFILFIFLLFFGWLWYKNSKPPKYNGLLWINPEHKKKSNTIETVIPIQREPEGQPPFWFQYEWFRWKKWPLYLWYETEPVNETREQDGKKYTVMKYPIKHWEPAPPPSSMRPNELFNITNWDCAKDFLRVESKVVEAIKIGATIAVAAVCVFGLIVLVDQINKNPKAVGEIIQYVVGVFM